MEFSSSWCAKFLLGLIASSSLGALAGCGAGGDDAGQEPTAEVLLELTTSPADAVCHKVSFVSPQQSFERSFDVAAGSGVPLTISALPAGTFTLTVTAFSQACASVPANAQATWVSAPVSVTLAAGTITGANVFLSRPASTNVVLDYDTAAVVYTAPAGTTIRAIAVQGTSLFIADSTQIVRQPEVGGGAVTLATMAGVTAVATDANNLVWATTSPSAAMYRLPTTGFGAPKVLLNTGATQISIGSGIAVTLDVSTVRAVPLNLASPNLPTPVFGSSGYNMVTSDSVNAYFAAPGQVYKTALTAPSGIPGTVLANTYPLKLASDGTTLFMTTEDALQKVPVAGGALTTMLSYFPTSIAHLVVDSTNVYFLTTAVTFSPTKCIGATLNRVAKNGVTATPIWSRPGVCPDRLAQSATALFMFDTSSNWVLRVPK